MKQGETFHQPKSNGAWKRWRRKVYVASSNGRGQGVFAARVIKPGERVLVFSGPKLKRSQITTQDELEHSLLIDNGVYVGPSGGEDDYVNHSCEPTTKLVGRQTLVAAREIAEGEEITVDYDTLWLEPGWTMSCACGSKRCRGLIGAPSQNGKRAF